MSRFDSLNVVALAGGVGGAKLADGLASILPPEQLTIIVNTGDDFEHFGLKICPDLDTVCYTLAGIANPETGWGRKDETWHVLENLEQLGGPTWFRLGDRDLATHLERTRLLRLGYTLSRITQRFCQSWGVKPTVLPMSDDPVATKVLTNKGPMPFQEYFVLRQCQPEVRGFQFKGVEYARPAPGVFDAIERADIVVICPSNPWVSIAPILAMPGMISCLRTSDSEIIRTSKRVILAISPIIGGKAVKGPAARMYMELGWEANARSVAAHYGAYANGGLLDGFMIDSVDDSLEGEIRAMGIEVHVTDILMRHREDRRRLAQEALEFAKSLLGQVTRK